MNVNDTEIVLAVLEKHNYAKAISGDDADIILLMTCAIREGAESKIWHRLNQLKAKKHERKILKEDLTVGIIGILIILNQDTLNSFSVTIILFNFFQDVWLNV